MAFPSSMTIQRSGSFTPSGITCEVYPSTVRNLLIELQSATANSTATSVWSSHIFGPSSAGPLRYTVPIPPSTRLYYLKARHPAGNGYSAGPFTPTISARSKQTPIIQRPFVMRLGYQGNVEVPSGADIFVSSSKTVKVGTQPTTGTITRTLRIPAQEVIPAATTSVYSVATAFVTRNTSGGVAFYGSVVMPTGVTITEARAQLYRNTAGSAASVSFRRTTGNATNTLLATLTASTGGWNQQVAATTELTSTARNYTIEVNLSLSSGQAARFGWFQVTYKRPTYSAVV